MTSPYRIAGVILSALMRGPCGLNDLCLSLGIKVKHSETPRRYINELYDLGVVYISDWTQNQWPIYSLQPGELFSVPDAPKPPNRRQREKTAAQDRRKRGVTYERPLTPKLKALPVVANSAFSQGAQ